VIQEEGLCVYNMHNIVEKHFSINIALMRSRGGSLVSNKIVAILYFLCTFAVLITILFGKCSWEMTLPTPAGDKANRHYACNIC
jgi:hypothetical protein